MTGQFSAHDKMICAQREMHMRKRVYARWVEKKTMSQAQADREIALMTEIASDYERQWRERELLL